MLKAPKFWSNPIGPLAMAVWPAGALYSIVVNLRDFVTRPTHASVPVICIGNPTLGGAGKTPAALYVAEALIRQNLRPHFLSRGYGGSFTGPTTVDPGTHFAGDVGDEPLLLAVRAPAHIARDRVAGAKLAVSSGAQIIVMDDGFQNPTLAKDISFLVVDGAAGCGNGLVFPAGPLRAPLRGQISRADALIVVGPGSAGEAVAELAVQAGVPVLRARLQPDEAAQKLAGSRVFAISGIGRPEKFLETVKGLGAELAGHRHFPDHHAYSRADLAQIETLATSLHAQTIVTTEKDFVRIGKSNDPTGRFRARLDVVKVKLEFTDPGELNALLEPVVRALRQEKAEIGKTGD